MLDNVTIRNPNFADDFDTLVVLSEEDRKKAANRLKELDQRYGHSPATSMHDPHWDRDVRS